MFKDCEFSIRQIERIVCRSIEIHRYYAFKGYSHHKGERINILRKKANFWEKLKKSSSVEYLVRANNYYQKIYLYSKNKDIKAAFSYVRCIKTLQIFRMLEVPYSSIETKLLFILFLMKFEVALFYQEKTKIIDIVSSSGIFAELSKCNFYWAHLNINTWNINFIC